MAPYIFLVDEVTPRVHTSHKSLFLSDIFPNSREPLSSTRFILVCDIRGVRMGMGKHITKNEDELVFM